MCRYELSKNIFAVKEPRYKLTSLPQHQYVKKDDENLDKPQISAFQSIVPVKPKYLKDSPHSSLPKLHLSLRTYRELGTHLSPV